jgi:hypothetical protein
MKESATKESETESTFTKMTRKTKSGAINKHCMHEMCEGKLISGYHWVKHLKAVHEGLVFACNIDYFYCDGNDCDTC